MVSSNEPLKTSRREEDLSSNKTIFTKRTYCAFQVSDEERWFLEFRLRHPEPSESFPYTELTRICNEWRYGTGVTLYFGHTTMVVIIKGENLTELYQAIEAGKLEWIAEFSPSEHEEPKDSSAPFIRSITIHTKRPEEIPLHVKRH